MTPEEAQFLELLFRRAIAGHEPTSSLIQAALRLSAAKEAYEDANKEFRALYDAYPKEDA